MCCKSNHSSLSSAIIEAAFLRHKLTPRGKIFSVLWTTVVRSELPRGGLPWTDFSPLHRKIPRPIKMVFDDIWPYSLCRPYGQFRQLASETDETLTRLAQSRHVYMCHAISFMSYDVSDLERFPISQEVMLFFCFFCFFFFISSTNFRFLTFLVCKILRQASENVKWKSRNVAGFVSLTGCKQ